MAARAKVVVAVQPEHRQTVLTSEVEARLREFASVVNLGTDERFSAEQMAEALTDAAGMITCWGTPKVTKAMVAAAPGLKIVAHTAGTLRPYVDPELIEQGIVVTSQAGAIARAVAEFTLGMILTGLRLTWRSDRLLQASRDWKAAHPPAPLCWEIEGRTIGVISLSRVGQLVAQKLASLGASVLAYDPYVAPEVFGICRAERASLEAIFERCTVVTIHAPVTPQTHHMVSRDLLARLPEGSLLVNTARGVLIDQAALEQQLVAGRLRAALDVTDPEPLPADNPLYGLPNVLITPHQAGMSVEARRRQGLGAVEDVRKALAGEPVPHAVKPEQWEILA